MAYTTIKKPSDYFNTKLWTGDGTSSRNITGVGFQPDWVWLKERSSNSSHRLCDIVRGVTKGLFTNLDSAEQTNSNALLSFDSDGFTIGDNGQVNENTQTYASWNWLADNTSGSSNTDGSITSTVSANTTSGFSIVSYTGTATAGTLGHGLSAVPKMIILKDRTSTRDWFVYHNSIGNNNRLKLNDSVASGATTIWNTTTPTSSVFSIDGDIYANASGNNYIAYCFADVKGFSKIGSYIGNGSTDGTFVYTGFKPAFVLVKNTAAVTSWQLIDNKRSDAGGYNIIDKVLAPNDSGAEYDEGSSAWCGDLLSNGFKWRGNWGALNGSGQTHIYMAFAEEPLVGDNPATAR